jgi:hypothetical protein
MQPYLRSLCRKGFLPADRLIFSAGAAFMAAQSAGFRRFGLAWLCWLRYPSPRCSMELESTSDSIFSSGDLPYGGEA